MLPLNSESLNGAIKTIEPIFRQRAEVAHIPGVAFGIVANGQLVGVQSFGIRELGDSSSVQPDTVFRIASMTKSFCAAAILQLRDAGKLQLDDLAMHYVPELKSLNYPTADTPAITIRHLLTMTAGIPQDDPWADRQLYRDDEAMSDFYRKGATFSAPPATRFEYSNYGYMLLGRIVSNVSGQGAMDYITDHLLKPLGMHDTVWNASEVPADRLAHGYFWLDGAWQPEEMLISGGDNALFAGLFTTVADLGRWVNLFLSAWPPRDEPENNVLKRSSLREMQQPWSQVSSYIKPQELGTVPEMSTDGYGYGLFTQHNGRYPTVGHGGGLPGFGSYMGWSPEHNIGVIALGNQRYSGFSQSCSDALTLLIKELQIVAPKPNPSSALIDAHDNINRLFSEWDDVLADKLFADNFFLDLDRPHRKRELEQLKKRHGNLRVSGNIIPEDWLRGGWRLHGDQGWVDVWISMTPTVPPLVQTLKIGSVMPLSESMKSVLDQLAELVTRPMLSKLDDLRSAESDRADIWEKVRLANLICGGCFLGDVIGSDGRERALVVFKGKKADTKVIVKLDESGKLAMVRFLNSEN